MDGSKCILQLRGVHPFLSNKYDLMKHPNIALTADKDERYTFDTVKYLRRFRKGAKNLKFKGDQIVEVYDIGETN